MFNNDEISRLLICYVNECLPGEEAARSKDEFVRAGGNLSAYKAETVKISHLFSISQCSAFVGQQNGTNNQGQAAANGSGTAMDIVVQMLTGKTFSIPCNSSDTIKDLKRTIMGQEQIPIDQQRLVFNAKELDNAKSLTDCSIGPGSTLRLILCMGQGTGTLLILDSALLTDSQYHYSFGNTPDTQVHYRGGEVYKRPIGWDRIAVKVTGKFDGGNDSWLGTNSKAWPVSFHSMGLHQGQTIAEFGQGAGSTTTAYPFRFGVYTTPDPKLAEKFAATFKDSKSGATYKILFQNRINPAHMIKLTSARGEFYVSKDDADIRPYGICIKKA